MIDYTVTKMIDIDGSTIYVTLYTVEDFLVNLTFHRVEKTKFGKEKLQEIHPNMIPEFVKNRWLRRINMKIYTELDKKELIFYKKEKEILEKQVRQSLKQDKNLKNEYNVLDIFNIAGFYAMLGKEKTTDKHVLMNVILHVDGCSLELFPSTSVDLLISKLITKLKKRDKAYHIQINGEVILGVQKNHDINFCQVVTAYFDVDKGEEGEDIKPSVQLKNTMSVMYKLDNDYYIPAIKEKIPEKLLANMEENGTKILDEIFDI